MNYKTGDKVTVKEGCKGACVTLENRDFDYLEIINVDDYDDDGYTYDAYLGDVKVSWCYNCYKDEHLEPYDSTVTWDNLKWKDIVVGTEGDERMVLGVLNDLVFLSMPDDFCRACAYFHKVALQNSGYTIKQIVERKVAETVELTLDEVAKKFGVDVKNLKIKE